LTNQSIGKISNSLDGKVQEIIIFDTDQSSNRTGIETNINDYYSIYAQDRDGFVTTWHNQADDEVVYTSDFTSGNEDLAESNVITTDGISIEGIDDVLKVELSGGLTKHNVFIQNQLPENGETLKLEFDYYIPSSNVLLDAIRISTIADTVSKLEVGTLDTWTSASVTYTTDRNDVFFNALNGSNLTIDADGDVFYLKNIVITQLASTYDATQTTDTQQPLIVEAGALVEENGKPAVDFDGVDDGMLTSGISLSASTISLSVVYTNGSTSGQKNIVRQRANGALTTLAGWSWEMGLNTSTTQYGANTFVDDGSGNISPSPSGQGLQDLIQHNEFLIFKNSEILAYQDSFLNETLNNTYGITPIGQLNVTQPIWLGRNFGDNAREYDGTMQEVILFYSDQSSNRTGIETNINDYYAIYAGSPVGGLLYDYPSSAAAYSLRQLTIYNNGYKETLVRVRRDSDNAEADFTADEITDGTMTAWVNTEVVKYSSDFSSTEDLAEYNGTGAAAQSVGGVDDAYKFTLSGGNAQHTAFTSTSILESGKSFTIVFDYYIPSGQTISSIVFDNLGGSGAFSGSLNVTDNWTTETINFTADGTRPRWWAGALGANVNADGDVFYLKNIVVTQTTTDGLVTTWYDQSGNGNDAVQGTAANQPKIINAGSLITSNGYTVIEYDGTDDNLSTSLTATGTMLMGGSDGSAFYEVAISGSYSLLASASLTDHPLRESIRVIWSSSLTTAQKTAIESLITYTDWDFSDVTSFYRYWMKRTELTNFPLIDTSSGTNFYAAWYQCSSLTSFPLLDVSSGTNFSYAWQECSSLTSFPQLDVSSGTNFYAAWYGCSSLTSFPLLDVSSGVNFFRAWRLCTSLTSFPLLDVSSGTSFQQTWYQCTSLQTFPANMFNSVTATNFTNAFTSTNLSSQSIDNILTSIDTANTSNGTFDQSGGSAPSATGEAAIDNLIARGWTITVTGGYQTYSTYKYRVETDGGTLYASRACTETAINNLKAL
jgi:hypothetical protein